MNEYIGPFEKTSRDVQSKLNLKKNICLHKNKWLR